MRCKKRPHDPIRLRVTPQGYAAAYVTRPGAPGWCYACVALTAADALHDARAWCARNRVALPREEELCPR